MDDKALKRFVEIVQRGGWVYCSPADLETLRAIAQKSTGRAPWPAIGGVRITATENLRPGEIEAVLLPPLSLGRGSS